jgi:hypothetical protein
MMAVRFPLRVTRWRRCPHCGGGHVAREGYFTYYCESGHRFFGWRIGPYRIALSALLIQ